MRTASGAFLLPVSARQRAEGEELGLAGGSVNAVIVGDDEEIAGLVDRHALDLVAVSYTHLDVYKRQHLAHRIRKEARAGDNIVLRITFLGENATAPVISRLSAIVGVDVNILAGRIDAIAGQPFGSLLVSCLLYTSRCV